MINTNFMFLKFTHRTTFFRTRMVNTINMIYTSKLSTIDSPTLMIYTIVVTEFSSYTFINYATVIVTENRLVMYVSICTSIILTFDDVSITINIYSIFLHSIIKFTVRLRNTIFPLTLGNGLSFLSVSIYYWLSKITTIRWI